MSEKLIPTHPPVIASARGYLDEVYLDWVNNYLTVEKFAEDHGLTAEEGKRLIDLARDTHTRKHTQAE